LDRGRAGCPRRKKILSSGKKKVKKKKIEKKEDGKKEGKKVIKVKLKSKST
jgi:hypothetical protein